MVTKKKVSKKKTPAKITTVKLELGEYFHCLYHTSQANFLKAQPNRFAFLEGAKIESGTMYFCDSYLEAQVLRAVLKAKDKVKTGLYSDESDMEGSFVVISPKAFKIKD